VAAAMIACAAMRVPKSTFDIKIGKVEESEANGQQAYLGENAPRQLRMHRITIMNGLTKVFQRGR
jgi:hypothetical protein